MELEFTLSEHLAIFTAHFMWIVCDDDFLSGQGYVSKDRYIVEYFIVF